VRHTVTVLPDGFVWQDRTYPSLSAVARASAIEAARGNGDQMTTPVTPANAMNVVYQHQAEAAAWLVERRDLAARRETINTMLRIAFLAFLVLTVLVYWLH
jgi:Protein of unknown function (DUF2924)